MNRALNDHISISFDKDTSYDRLIVAVRRLLRAADDELTATAWARTDGPWEPLANVAALICDWEDTHDITPDPDDPTAPWRRW